MEQSKITIAGHEVGVAYCYATEIAFRNYTGVNVANIDANNPEHVVYLIIAAVFAYYNAKKEELPISDNDVLNEASPEEISGAAKAILEMCGRWYHLPNGEAEPDSESGQEGDRAPD